MRTIWKHRTSSMAEEGQILAAVMRKELHSADFELWNQRAGHTSHYCHFLGAGSWENHLISLGLSLFICKMGRVLEPLIGASESTFLCLIKSAVHIISSPLLIISILKGVVFELILEDLHRNSNFKDVGQGLPCWPSG